MFTRRSERFFQPEYETRSAAAPLECLTGFAQWQGTREEQNDEVLIAPLSPQGTFIAIADGIGTEKSAGEAASLAIRTIRVETETYRGSDQPIPWLLHTLSSAHAQIRQFNDDELVQGRASTGASIACVMEMNRTAYVASVGNVRVFLLRGGALLQLNRDHLLCLDAEEQSILAGEEPEIEPEWAMCVTAYAGMHGLKKLDWLRQPLTLMPDDRLIVMSSGLYGVLPDSEIVRTLRDYPPRQAAKKIIAGVQNLERDSQSNASIAVMQMTRITGRYA